MTDETKKTECPCCGDLGIVAKRYRPLGDDDDKWITSCEACYQTDCQTMLVFTREYHNVEVFKLIAAESLRAIANGYDEAHDDEHVRGEIAEAATVYADIAAMASREPEQPINESIRNWYDPADAEEGPVWPWDINELKIDPDPIRNLVRAGNLIFAEIKRLQRAKAKVAKCETCKGTGTVTCGDCDGDGEAWPRQGYPCGLCSGTGCVPCPACNTKGGAS